MVEKREKEKSKRIDKFNKNVGNFGNSPSAAASNDSYNIEEDRISIPKRTIRNRRLLLDSYYEQTDEVSSKKEEIVVVLDDEEPRHNHKKTTTSHGLASKLPVIVDDEDGDDECVIMPKINVNVASRNTKSAVNQASKFGNVDIDDDEDEDFNKWLVNDTFFKRPTTNNENKGSSSHYFKTVRY